MIYEPKKPIHEPWKMFSSRGPAGATLWAFFVSRDSPCIRVYSAVEEVETPGSGIIVPHWHCSSSSIDSPVSAPRPCSDEEMGLVRYSFEMEDADEDNHGPGIVRHLWMVCGARQEPACPCKVDAEVFRNGPRCWTTGEEEG